MDVADTRQLGRVDLDYRADHHELPLRALRGNLTEQRHIEPLIDHAIEAQARVRDVGLIRWVILRVARSGEMRHVHAAGERVRIGMQGALGFPDAVAAGEHHIGALQQLTFALHQFRRRATEGG